MSQLVLAAAGQVAMMHKLLPQLVPALIRARSRAASWSLRRPDIWSGGLCTKSHQRQQPPGELFTFPASARGLGEGSRGFIFFFLSFFPLTSKTSARISRAKSRPRQVCADLCDPPQLFVCASPRSPVVRGEPLRPAAISGIILSRMTPLTLLYNGSN